jgi:hypothetical protein
MAIYINNLPKRLGFQAFLNFREKERGEAFCFERLAKDFIGADSRKLKMRRLPPTRVQIFSGLHLTLAQ